MTIDGVAPEPQVPKKAATEPFPRLEAGRFLWFGMLPLAGLLCELEVDFAASRLGLFPNRFAFFAVLAAVVANVPLQLQVVRRWLWPTELAILVGFVSGMAALYAVVVAPLLPTILFGLLVMLIGLLGAGPYLVLIGLPKIWRDVRKQAAAAGRSPRRAVVQMLSVAVATIALLVLLADGFEPGPDDDRRALWQLALAMGDDKANEAEVDRLAAAVRAGSVERQREICREWPRVDPLSEVEVGSGLRPGGFWFLRGPKVGIAERRAAFHRAHGRSVDEDDRFGTVRRSPGHMGDPAWTRSDWTIAPEPRAAVARLDWEIVVVGRSQGLQMAWFELELPPGVVASSLSSWIDGEERPAAFASDGRAKQAFDAVVAKRRDPVLLREVAPGRLWMQLFPLSQSLPPMRVRVGFTVPLQRDGEGMALALPALVDHTCAERLDERHTLRIEVGGEAGAKRTLGEDEWTQPVRIPGAPAPVTCARDADGFVVQTLAPLDAVAAPGTPRPIVLVFDASYSTAFARENLVQLLQSLPAGRRLSVHAAHGGGAQHHEAIVGDEALTVWVRSQPFDGGTDARPALAAATAEAARLGVANVFWLHGRASDLFPRTDVAWAPDVLVHAVPLTAALHPLHGEAALRAQIVPSPWRPFAEMQRWLLARLDIDVAHGVFGGFVRTFARASTPPPDAVVVDDQLVRLWAAHEARDRQRRHEATAAGLAASYRVVTAGASAVVLESREQYDEHKLEPGAITGREPPELLGGQPVPEPATWLLLGSGLAVIAWRQRRRSLAARAPSV